MNPSGPDMYRLPFAFITRLFAYQRKKPFTAFFIFSIIFIFKTVVYMVSRPWG